MFWDINGNTFSTLGNSNQVPAFDLNPQQIFGNELVVWLDFTDKSTLFTNTACTTNVTTYGDYIRGIRDKSFNRKVLRAIGDTTTNWQWSSNTLNNLPCCLRTTGVTSQLFNHEDATFFLTSNTNFSAHIVVRFVNAAINQLVYGIGTFGGGGIGINSVIPGLTYQNVGNQGSNMTSLLTTTGLQIVSGTFNILVPASTSTYTLNYNNQYTISGTNARSSGQNYGSGRFTVPNIQSGVIPQNYFMQEIFLARGLATSEQLSFAHQYLRLKYGGT